MKEGQLNKLGLCPGGLKKTEEDNGQYSRCSSLPGSVRIILCQGVHYTVGQKHQELHNFPPLLFRS